MLTADLQRQARFGYVRPAVHAEWQGLKWVAVGCQVLSSRHWKTPLDFFGDYLKHVMTRVWGKAELLKPLADRHPVMQWYDAMCRLQALSKQQAGPDGLYYVVPSGFMRAYSLLAYDLYILQHHGLLQDRLLHRLRNKDQYQGARHELFAAATCVRAGFDIDYEDESDRSTKHTEFIATHRQTGMKICIEAKSKHRAGVLGMEGDRAADDEVRTRLGGLINDALQKPHNHPLIIFLDLNLPPTSPACDTPEWLQRFVDPLLRGVDREGEEDPWDLIVFSNQPDHYAMDDAPVSGGYARGVCGKNARIGPEAPAEFMLLIDAASKFGTIPNRFDEM